MENPNVDKPKKSSQEKNYFGPKVFELELDTSTNDSIKLGPPFATVSCFQMALNQQQPAAAEAAAAEKGASAETAAAETAAGAEAAAAAGPENVPFSGEMLEPELHIPA